MDIVNVQQVLEAAWRSPADPPEAQSTDPGFSVAVMGVVDDPQYCEGAFVDVVNYWPAQRAWTITHTCSKDVGAEDRPVHIRAWQPMLPLPAPWRDLWA